MKVNKLYIYIYMMFPDRVIYRQIEILIVSLVAGGADTQLLGSELKTEPGHTDENACTYVYVNVYIYI